MEMLSSFGGDKHIYRYIYRLVCLTVCIWVCMYESKGLKVNLGKSKVCGGITKDGMSKSKVDPCRVCSFRVKANSVLCLQCEN